MPIGPGNSITPFKIREWKAFREYPFSWDGQSYRILCARDPSILSPCPTAVLQKGEELIGYIAFGRVSKRTLHLGETAFPIRDISRYSALRAGCTIVQDDHEVARFFCPQKFFQKTLECSTSTLPYPIQAFVALSYFLYQ